MTRKQALQKALFILETLDQTDEICEIQNKIIEVIEELPFTSWSEETVFDTLTQFAVEHGRNPTVHDLRAKGMPSHPTIKNRFKMTAKEFLSQYFPPKNKSKLIAYNSKPKEEWQKYFIARYNSLESKRAMDFDKNRPIGTPSWPTIAAMFGCKKWFEWLELCEVELPKRAPYDVYSRNPKKFKVTVHSTVLDEKKALDKKIAALAASE